MQELNFETSTNLTPSTIDPQCHDEGYEAYFDGTDCPYSNEDENSFFWSLGYKHAQMDDGE